jgi:hypothetical protein
VGQDKLGVGREGNVVFAMLRVPIDGERERERERKKKETRKEKSLARWVKKTCCINAVIIIIMLGYTMRWAS